MKTDYSLSQETMDEIRRRFPDEEPERNLTVAEGGKFPIPFVMKSYRVYPTPWGVTKGSLEVTKDED